MSSIDCNHQQVCPASTSAFWWLCWAIEEIQGVTSIKMSQRPYPESLNKFVNCKCKKRCAGNCACSKSQVSYCSGCICHWQAGSWSCSASRIMIMCGKQDHDHVQHIFIQRIMTQTMTRIFNVMYKNLTLVSYFLHRSMPLSIILMFHHPIGICTKSDRLMVQVFKCTYTY